MKSTLPTFPALLQRFFTQRLMQQKRVSAHTISSYRDTFRLLLQFAQKRLRTSPDRLAFEKLDAPFIAAFLNDLESARGITVRTRNLRLTAIRSFFRFAAYEMPTHAAQIQRVLAMPTKRFDRRLIDFMTRPEADALLKSPDNDLEWPPRSRAVADNAANWLAAVGSDRPGAPQLHLRYGRSCRSPRQGPQATRHSTLQTSGRGARRMARRIEPDPRRHCLPEHARRTIERGCGRPLAEKASGSCRREMRIAEKEAHHVPLPAPHDGNGPAPRRGGAIRHRFMVRP